MTVGLVLLHGNSSDVSGEKDDTLQVSTKKQKQIDTCDDTCVVKKRKTELTSDIAHLYVAEMQIHASKREREVTDGRL